MRRIIAITILVATAIACGSSEFDEDGVRAFLAANYPNADVSAAIEAVRDTCTADSGVFRMTLAMADSENLALIRSACPDRVRAGE